VPIWLAETRRRIFCSSYNQDKSISTFLGRPIRISKRHTDISLPLDLSDEETSGDQATLTQAINSLDKDGWNTKGRWLRASWIVCDAQPQTYSLSNIAAATLHLASIPRGSPRVLPYQARRIQSTPTPVSYLSNSTSQTIELTTSL
jgi:hypothetical protein